MDDHDATGERWPCEALLARNSAYIPGGISSINRIIDPPISFLKGEGALAVGSIDSQRYIDYHAAFAPHFLGHNFPPVNDAVIDALRAGASLFGAGPSRSWKERLAELICKDQFRRWRRSACKTPAA